MSSSKNRPTKALGKDTKQAIENYETLKTKYPN